MDTNLMTISNKNSPHIITPLLTLIPHISKGFIQHCGKRLENTNTFNSLFIRDKITNIRGFPQESNNNCGKLVVKQCERLVSVN